MNKTFNMIKTKWLLLFFLSLWTTSCKKGNGANTTPVPPSNLVVTADVSTDNSGNVGFTATAVNAVSYDFDYGNGVFATIPSGTVTYKYPFSGTYKVRVTAKSAGGLTITKSIDVVVSVTLSLVWSDEFDTPGAPDPSKWGYDTGGGGWGNNELQYYTNTLENAVVSNGTLKITAKTPGSNGMAYTSARLLSKDKFSFKYGKVEARAKLPSIGGTWPAIWMLGDDINTAGWPACGEIDIMEHRGNELNKIFGTLHHPGHSGGNGDGSTVVILNASTEFHRYGLEWTPFTIKIMVDDLAFFTFNNSGNLPFNQNFFLILNLAMGGTFGGSVDPTFTTATMEVDYVRVYQ